jgi:hypothetical protein
MNKTIIKKTGRKSIETEENTNIFPIYPDWDGPLISTGKWKGQLSDQELAREIDTLNPDPNSLDRG